MKTNNKGPQSTSIVTLIRSRDSGVPKAETGAFSFTFLKCVDLLILYEKLSTTPAKEIKRLAMEEIKKELKKLQVHQGKMRKDK